MDYKNSLGLAKVFFDFYAYRVVFFNGSLKYSGKSEELSEHFEKSGRKIDRKSVV